MTDVEFQRMRDYSGRLTAQQGDVSVLNAEERQDLAEMLLKWQAESEVAEKS